MIHNRKNVNQTKKKISNKFIILNNWKIQFYKKIKLKVKSLSKLLYKNI